MKQVQESIKRHLETLDTADRTLPVDLPAKTERIQDKLAKLRRQVSDLHRVDQQLRQQPDQQLSLTDPDARSMATSGRGTGIVGYNVQIATDTTHHFIVAHEVLNVGHDRAALLTMAKKAQEALGRKGIGLIADRGCYKGPEIAGKRAGRREHLRAQAPDLGQQSRRSTQQGGLRLHRQGPGVPMPRETDPVPAIRHR